MQSEAVTVRTPELPAVRDDLDRLKEMTGRIIGSVFYGTMLKAMRESELKGPYGHGGHGEEVFAAQLHGIWAEQMGVETRGGLAEALYDHLAKQQTLISTQLQREGVAQG